MESRERNLILIGLVFAAILIIVCLCFIIFDDDLFSSKKTPIATKEPVSTATPIPSEEIKDDKLIDELDNFVKIDSRLFDSLSCTDTINFEDYQKILITIYTYKNKDIFKFSGKYNQDAVVSDKVINEKANILFGHDVVNNSYPGFNDYRLISAPPEIDNNADYNIYRVEYKNNDYYVRNYRLEIEWPYLSKVEVPFKLEKQGDKYILSEYYLYFIFGSMMASKDKYYSNADLKNVVLDYTGTKYENMSEGVPIYNVPDSTLYDMIKEKGKDGKVGVVKYTFTKTNNNEYKFTHFCRES